MLDEPTVKELAVTVRELTSTYKRQHETTKKLMRLCIKHLEDRRRLMPDAAWRERKQLIAALKTLTEGGDDDRRGGSETTRDHGEGGASTATTC